MKKLLKGIWLLALITQLFACSSITDKGHAKLKIINLPLNYALFNSEIYKDKLEEDIFYLTPVQQQEVQVLINKAVAKGTPKHIALNDLLTSKLANFTYYGDTYPAEAAMRLNKGNCMSLAVLTGAFAQVVGLEFSYREVNTLPVFDKQNNLLLSSSHVQTLLHEEDFTPDADRFYFGTPGIIIDYFPSSDNRRGKKVSRDSFSAMYYKNLASNALIEDDFNKAFYLAEKAYQFDKSNASVINLLAVIHRRSGDVTSAEGIYKAGLEIEPSSLALMSNYVVLLQTEQRHSEAKVLEDKLDFVDDPNPYIWLEQAYVAQMNNEIPKASRYYQKVIEKAPYLNEPYIELYKIYKENGQVRLAKKMLINALEWTYEIAQRKQYKYKLYSLNLNLSMSEH
ncbi:hypothetical protein KO495_06165 [Colwellia sp. D2M02]|uniref:tetratricopeptide repeat protein n=1 Tax=Colwellia sp. D2M02 TaxID=2841562 RepID=UPI001C0952C5|nr:hypothetical protein [Colwellia sp. D2M02]MBU2892907.1 hypothetical protein [Colwellia sp. D2M02]